MKKAAAVAGTLHYGASQPASCSLPYLVCDRCVAPPLQPPSTHSPFIRTTHRHKHSTCFKHRCTDGPVDDLGGCCPPQNTIFRVNP